MANDLITDRANGNWKTQWKTVLRNRLPPTASGIECLKREIVSVDSHTNTYTQTWTSGFSETCCARVAAHSSSPCGASGATNQRPSRNSKSGCRSRVRLRRRPIQKASASWSRSVRPRAAPPHRAPNAPPPATAAAEPSTRAPVAPTAHVNIPFKHIFHNESESFRNGLKRNVEWALINKAQRSMLLKVSYALSKALWKSNQKAERLLTPHHIILVFNINVQ